MNIRQALTYRTILAGLTLGILLTSERAVSANEIPLRGPSFASTETEFDIVPELAAAPTPRPRVPPRSSPPPSFLLTLEQWGDAVAERMPPELTLQGGLRSFHTLLLANRQGGPWDNSFIGSIYGLDAEQNYFPFRPYLQAVFDPGFGLGITYDRLRIATVDHGGGDGDVIMNGFHLYVMYEHRNETIATPYGELGYVFYDVRFEHLPEFYEGGRREFVLQNTSGLYLAGGVRLAISENWHVDLHMRYVDVDVNGTYIFRGDRRGPEDFVLTMKHLAYGLGIGFQFP